MVKNILNENKLKSLIKEVVKSVLNENTKLNKYNVFYIGEGDSIYNGYYQTSFNAKDDKTVLKMFLNEFPQIYLANLDGDLNKTENYVIGKVVNQEDDDWELVYNIDLYTRNGKKVEYKSTYYGNNDISITDSYQERNKKRFIGYMSDVMGNKLINIPEGYCKNISLIKKFAENFSMKQYNENGKDSFYAQVCDLKTNEWTEYNCFIFNFGGDIEFEFNKAK